MGACAATGFGYVEVGSVCMSCKYRVAGAVGDAVVGIGHKSIRSSHFDECLAQWDHFFGDGEKSC